MSQQGSTWGDTFKDVFTDLTKTAAETYSEKYKADNAQQPQNQIEVPAGTMPAGQSSIDFLSQTVAKNQTLLLAGFGALLVVAVVVKIARK